MSDTELEPTWWFERWAFSWACLSFKLSVVSWNKIPVGSMTGGTRVRHLSVHLYKEQHTVALKNDTDSSPHSLLSYLIWLCCDAIVMPLLLPITLQYMLCDQSPSRLRIQSLFWYRLLIVCLNVSDWITNKRLMGHSVKLVGLCTVSLCCLLLLLDREDLQLHFHFPVFQLLV